MIMFSKKRSKEIYLINKYYEEKREREGATNRQTQTDREGKREWGDSKSDAFWKKSYTLKYKKYRIHISSHLRPLNENKTNTARSINGITATTYRWKYCMLSNQHSWIFLFRSFTYPQWLKPASNDVAYFSQLFINWTLSDLSHIL